MRHFALIGRTLTHSYSKRLFDDQHFPDADYRLCAMPSLDGLRQWVGHDGINGFNVTNPYKQAILPLLDALSPEAEAIGAVNCVVVENGRLIGHNTDAPAFRDTLSTLHSPLSTPHSPLSALILGTGGAAHAVSYALDQLGIDHTFVSRTPEQWKAGIRKHKVVGYQQLPVLIHPSPMLVVNATPVGTYPDVDHTPLDPSTLHSPLSTLRSPLSTLHSPLSTLHSPLSTLRSPLSTFHFYDLVYNPSPTLLLRQAAALGATTQNGLDMLRRQAELSWELWHL